MALEFQDYYSLLGVPKTATEKEIRSAYRKLARQFHPDVNPGKPEAEAQFKRISEAYEVLSDSEKRKKYDQLGARWKEYGAQSPPRGREGERYEYRSVALGDLQDLFGDEQPFSDFFETFFRSDTGRRAPKPRRGTDLEFPLEVSLEEAYRGATRVLEFQLPDGQTRRLEVKIPVGATNGSRVRIAGQGALGRAGGQAGDVYLVTMVRSDPQFEREGDDLRTRVRAPLATMVLGGEVHVPTPDGRRLALTIPAGTQDGRVFRLRGQGIPHLGEPDRRGDLNAEVHALLPERVSARQRELLEAFVRAGEESPVGGAV